MVEPITITIITLITSGIMILAASLAIIKNGSDITDNIAEWYRDKRYHNIVITKSSNLPSFVALCNVFSTYKSRIKCKNWQIIAISDSSGKMKSFAVPSVGRFIELKFKSYKVIIYVFGTYGKMSDVSGFKIYFKNENNIVTFIEEVFKKYLSSSDISDLVKFYRQNYSSNSKLKDQ